VIDFHGWPRIFYSHLPVRAVHAGGWIGRFRNFVQWADVSIIVLDQYLVNDPQYRDDPDFQEFLAGKRSGDFRFFTVSDEPVRIAVRKDLLAESGGTGSAHIPGR